MSMRALHRHAPIGCIPLLVPLLAPLGAFGQRIIYVNAAATGADNGTSWADAFTDLQGAFDVARDSPLGPCDIWVAAGTYKPDRGTGDRLTTFRLSDGVRVYGGFAGGETDCDQRDPAVNVSVLSGDLNDDDDPRAPALSNCCEQVFGGGCDNGHCMERVAVFDPTCNPHRVWDVGCVYFAQHECPELCRPTRTDNSYGLLRASGLVQGALIDGLTIVGGEAICPLDPPNPDCAGSGGLEVEGSVIEVNGCRFFENQGSNGTALGAVTSVLSIKGCRFERNGHFQHPRPTLEAVATDLVTIEDSQFVDNNATGLLALSDSTIIRRSVFEGNAGSGLALVGSGATTVRDCIFAGNSTSGNGGGVMNSGGVSSYHRCLFLNNQSVGAGGGLRSDLANAVVANCVFVGNTAGAGGGIYTAFGVLTLLNSTIVGNDGGGIDGHASYLANSIFWGNTAKGLHGERAQIDVDSLTLEYNCVQGWTGALGGVGNVGLDPLFVDPDGPDDTLGTIDDNLRLSAASPLIDLGAPAPPLVPYVDTDLHARILCGRVDMGAYEFGIGDYNCDRVFELSDFGEWPTCTTGPDGGPYQPDCAAFDFLADMEDRIDLLDFAGLQNAIPSTWP